MRTSVGFASILLLLVATAHGIRLDRQYQETINSKQKMVVSPTSGQEASIARSVNKHCIPDGHCASSAGTAKKRLTHAESGAAKQMQGSAGNGHSKTDVDADAAKTTSKQGRHDAAVASSDRSVYQQAAAAATPRQRQTTTYPDMMDIAGMDYSPATRRSPIHN